MRNKRSSNGASTTENPGSDQSAARPAHAEAARLNSLLADVTARIEAGKQERDALDVAETDRRLALRREIADLEAETGEIRDRLAALTAELAHEEALDLHEKAVMRFQQAADLLVERKAAAAGIDVALRNLLAAFTETRRLDVEIFRLTGVGSGTIGEIGQPFRDELVVQLIRAGLIDGDNIPPAYAGRIQPLGPVKTCEEVADRLAEKLEAAWPAKPLRSVEIEAQAIIAAARTEEMTRENEDLRRRAQLPYYMLPPDPAREPAPEVSDPEAEHSLAARMDLHRFTSEPAR